MKVETRLHLIRQAHSEVGHPDCREDRCDMRFLLTQIAAERSARQKAEAAAAERFVALQDWKNLRDTMFECHLDDQKNYTCVNQPFCREHYGDGGKVLIAMKAALASDAGTALLAALKGLYEALRSLHEEQHWELREHTKRHCLEAGAALDAARPWLPVEKAES